MRYKIFMYLPKTGAISRFDGCLFGVAFITALLLIQVSAHAVGPESSVGRVKDERRRLDATVWASEVSASNYSSAVVDLWDRLRQSKEQLKELSRFPIGRLRFGVPSATTSLDLGVKQIEFGAPNEQMLGADWQTMLAKFASQGFRLVESEWHHSAFRQDNDAVVSTVDFELHVLHQRNQQNPTQDARVIVRGKLEIEWSNEPTAQQPVTAKTVTALELTMLTRAGRPVFEHAFTYERRANDVASAHPIILHDLDKNGAPEIIVSRWNRVYWNEGGGKFRERRMFADYTPLAEAGLVADITDDGHADFLSVNKLGQVVLFEGSESGEFTVTPKVVSESRVPSALPITAGDIDADGDLDLWIPQYKPAYLDGQMPTPYYDANDGEQAVLLVNDGQAHFEDKTDAAGLGAKRRRRSYSSSFVDFDGDHDLDLVVVSDYAGVDIYRNEGNGKFQDVTDQVVPEKHLFGMAHAFGDYNGDAKLDLYAIGMSSTTARRLDAMKLSRDDRKDIAQMRAAMGFGNRIYAWNGSQFATPSFASQLARTGWSWGVATFDYDLDGDEDTYVANGFRSGKSCKDYCSTFWRHDIYTGDSKSNPVVASIFSDSMRELNAGQMSWNGYEHNALIQNNAGQDFKNIAFLMGVGCEFDSRAVIGNDLDGDGRPDLIVTEYEFAGQGYIMKLHVFRNVLPTKNNWLGLRLPESGGHAGLFGATATLKAGDTKQIRHLVSGDSFLAQHDNSFHFGVGSNRSVDEVVVRWPNGARQTLRQPMLNKYHVVTPTDADNSR